MSWLRRCVATHALQLAQGVSVSYVFAFVLLALIAIGCSSSIDSAPVRYRQQHENGRTLLPDITVQRLQACAEDYAGQLDENSLGIDAKVHVDREGNTLDVIVTGFPENARDLETCASIALNDMAVPMLPLRASTTGDLADKSAGQHDNLMANPAVFVEVAILLGEFAAQHGGKIILYTITIQVLSAIAVEGYKMLSKKCRQVKEQCIISCGDSTLPTRDPGGVPFHKCLRECMERAGCFYNAR